MAILQLKSNNPKFSHIIFKNPSTGMLIKDLRKGHLFGWYSDDTTYNCFFKDASNDISYKSHPDESFEYINTTRFNSAMFVVNTFSELFSYTLKRDLEQDISDAYEHEIILNMLHVTAPRYLEFFNKHFDDFTIDFEEIAFKNCRIHIKTKKTLRELLNFTSLFVIFNALRNNDNLMMDSGIIEKYLENLRVIDAPYFIRYIFKINFIRNRKNFEKYISILENSKKEKIKFKLGNTQLMRLRDIESHLNFRNPIVDLGCGEGHYVSAFSSSLKDNTYYAIDREESCRNSVQKKIDRKKLSNVKIYDNFSSFKENAQEDDRYDVILTEVIEHSPLEESESLIKDLVKFDKLGRAVLTTPNKEFNQFYLFEESELRHDDHSFEFTKSEFKEWLQKIVPEKLKLSFFDSGDIVNDIPCTLGAVIEREEQ